MSEQPPCTGMPRTCPPDAHTAWNMGYDAAIEEAGLTDYGLTPNPFQRQEECAHAASTTERGHRVCDRCGLELPAQGYGPDGDGHVDQPIHQSRR